MEGKGQIWYQDPHLFASKKQTHNLYATLVRTLSLEVDSDYLNQLILHDTSCHTLILLKFMSNILITVQPQTKGLSVADKQNPSPLFFLIAQESEM